MGINETLISKYAKTDRLVSDFYKMRDKNGNVIQLDNIVLPLRIDNRQLMSPTDNQLNLPACAGFSAATLLETLIWQKTGIIHQLNSEQVYAEAKKIDNAIQDEGTYLECALQAILRLSGLDKQGIKIGLAYNDSTSKTIQIVKRLVHKHMYIQAGFMIDDAWYKCNNSNFILKKGNTSCGGHAVNICGYDEDGFYILNQWGTSFGANGYCIIPYDLFLKEFMYCAYLYNIPEVLNFKFQ